MIGEIIISYQVLGSQLLVETCFWYHAVYNRFFVWAVIKHKQIKVMIVKDRDTIRDLWHSETHERGGLSKCNTNITRVRGGIERHRPTTVNYMIVPRMGRRSGSMERTSHGWVLSEKEGVRSSCKNERRLGVITEIHATIWKKEWGAVMS